MDDCFLIRSTMGDADQEKQEKQENTLALENDAGRDRDAELDDIAD